MKFYLYGAEDSRFLRGIRSRAAKAGIDCEITMDYKPSRYYVCDWETYPDYRKLPDGYNLEKPVPAVACAVVNLIDKKLGSIEGQTVLIIGRGNATTGLEAMLQKRNATTIVANSHTKNMTTLIEATDIIINAAPGFNIEDKKYFMHWREIFDLTGNAVDDGWFNTTDSMEIGKATIGIIVERMKAVERNG